MATQQVEPKDLIAEQIKLEEGMTIRGGERYLREINRLKGQKAEAQTDYGSLLISSRLQTLSLAIEAWRTEASKGGTTFKSSSVTLMDGLDSNTLAYLTLRCLVQGITFLQSLQSVAVNIGAAIEEELVLETLRKAEKAAYTRTIRGISKRVSQKHKEIYAMRVAEDNLELDRWSRIEKLHCGTKLVYLAVEHLDLVEVAHVKAASKKSMLYLKALPEILEWIEKRTEVTKMLRPVYEPMVVQPRDWTTPFDGGYLTSNIKPLRLVKVNNKAYLEELKNTDMPIVYQAVNALQRTAWQINTRVLDVMETLWNRGERIAGLPDRYTGELKDHWAYPVPPVDIDTNEETRKLWRISAAKFYQDVAAESSKRISTSMLLDIAKRYNEYRKIYFPYQLDFRGRIYAVPHLNPQGSDHAKALIRFANGKPLGENGWKWLAIHGSNLAGYDKVSFEDRVEWVMENDEEIARIAEDPYSNQGWCTEIGGQKVDKPWQFLAFCFEWAGFMKHGDSFVSKLPIALDGSCSGIQHFSAMLRDEVGGNAVNLLPADKPQDVYGMVAQEVIKIAENDSQHGTEDELMHTEDGRPYIKQGTRTLACEWLSFGINRKVTKRSVMTLAYGSKEYGFKEQLMEDILRPASGRLDFPFKGDGYAAASYMAKAIWRSVNKVLVAAGECMSWLQEAARVAASEGLPVRWTTAVGFPVIQAYPNLEQRRVDTKINGKLVFRLVMNEQVDGVDKRKQAQGVSPNFVHSCDAAHLMLTTVRAAQQGIKSFAMIHDSFGTTAADTETLFMTIREAFVEMYEEVDVLETFRDELFAQLSEKNQEKLPPLPEKGTLELASVVESRYCFA